MNWGMFDFKEIKGKMVIICSLLITIIIIAINNAPIITIFPLIPLNLNIPQFMLTPLINDIYSIYLVLHSA